MKTILLWDLRFPDRKPNRLTIDDAVASAAVRAGVAAARDPADSGALATGGPISNAYPVDVLLPHGSLGSLAKVVLPLAVAQVAVAAGASILPANLQAYSGALVAAGTSDFIISPIDGQQLLGAI